MKRLLAAFLTFFLLAAACRPALPAKMEQEASPLPTPVRRILLDYGHGGFDGGAVGVDTGVVEAELNLALGEALRTILEAEGFTVELTRTDENALGATKREDMAARAKLLQKEGYDAVISIHMNKFSDRSVSGPMVYYQAGAKEGERLAQAIVEALTKALERKSRLANPGNNMVTRLPTAPAVLVECGFLSNAEDERRLQVESYRLLLARAIADGLIAYFAKSED